MELPDLQQIYIFPQYSSGRVCVEYFRAYHGN